MSLLLDARKKINLAQHGHHSATALRIAVHARGRVNIIPVAIIIGLVFAAGGGYYVWSETFSPAPMQRQNLVLPPAAAAIEAAAPLVATPAPIHVAPLPKNLSAAPEKQVAAKDFSPASVSAVSPEPDVYTLQDTSANLAQPIRISHSKESDAVDPALLAAYQAYRNGDLRAAWQQYSDILHGDAKNRDALLGLAAIAQQQSQDSIAAHYYNQVLAFDPRDPIAHAGMYSLLGTGHGADSESRLKLLLAQHPEAAPLHFVLGNYYAQQSRWSDAQQAYFRACDLESGNAQFAFNLAVSLDHMGQGKLAAQHYQRALQLDSAGNAGSANAGFEHAQTQSRLDELTAH